jgi:hypothetical protein
MSPRTRHALVVAAVLLALIEVVLWEAEDRLGFVLGLGFVFMPIGVVYTVISTALVFALKERRRAIWWAHGIALPVGIAAVFFWIK